MKKWIIITGATGYFGRYFLEGLSPHFNILALSRNEAKVAGIAKEANIVPLVCDLNDLNETQDKLEKAFLDYDIYGLINNAYDFSEKSGFNTPQGRLENITPEILSYGIHSGLVTPAHVAILFARHLIAKKIQGSIVNVSSMYGLVAPDRRLYEGKTVLNPPVYAMAKFGLIGLTKYLASFLGEYQIRCNAICPGPFPNVETQSSNSTQDDQFLQRLKDKTCLNRVGHPRELLGAVKLLLSDESSYITGQTISIDGGWTSI